MPQINLFEVGTYILVEEQARYLEEVLAGGDDWGRNKVLEEHSNWVEEVKIVVSCGKILHVPTIPSHVVRDEVCI